MNIQAFPSTGNEVNVNQTVSIFETERVKLKTKEGVIKGLIVTVKEDKKSKTTIQDIINLDKYVQIFIKSNEDEV